jgi:hypothetical protein
LQQDLKSTGKNFIHFGWVKEYISTLKPKQEEMFLSFDLENEDVVQGTEMTFLAQEVLLG